MATEKKEVTEKNVTEKKDVNEKKDEFWVLNLKVITTSPLYTGENKQESNRIRKTGNRLPTRKTGDGFASVTLYGPLRYWVETIYKDEGTCDIGKNAQGCGRCLSCDIFGSLGRKGRVSIEELKSVLPFEKIVNVVVHPRIDRETGTIPSGKGASIEVEEVLEGTEFFGRIINRYPKDRDLEILEAALKAIEFNGLGGWTKRSRGRVSITSNLEKKRWSSFKKIGEEESKKLET